MNELENLIASIKTLTDIDEASLTDEMLKAISDNMDEQFSPSLVMQSVNQIVKNLEDQGLTKEEANNSIKELSNTLKEMVYGEQQYKNSRRS